MKKKYATPQTQAVTLSHRSTLLAGSIQVNSSGEPVDAGNAAAPGFNFDIFED